MANLRVQGRHAVGVCRVNVMRGLLRLVLSGDHGGETPSTALCQPLPEPVETHRDRSQPVETNTDQPAIDWQIPTRRWVTPAERAAAILEFLQGPGGRTGSIPWNELQKLHLEICGERDWEPMGWTAVGRELSDLIKEERKAHEKGKRVYRIPPLAGWSRLRAV